MNKKLLLALPLLFVLTACGKPAVGADMAKSACTAWKTAWSNALSINIGDARSQFYDYNAAYDLAKSATDLNKEWKPISDAIGSYWIYAGSSFNDSLFPDAGEAVKGMDVCKKVGVEVNG